MDGQRWGKLTQITKDVLEKVRLNFLGYANVDVTGHSSPSNL